MRSGEGDESLCHPSLGLDSSKESVTQAHSLFSNTREITLWSLCPQEVLRDFKLLLKDIYLLVAETLSPIITDSIPALALSPTTRWRWNFTVLGGGLASHWASLVPPVLPLDLSTWGRLYECLPNLGAPEEMS